MKHDPAPFNVGDRVKRGASAGTVRTVLPGRISIGPRLVVDVDGATKRVDQYQVWLVSECEAAT